MKSKLVIVDTSILVVWLQVPGFEEAGEERLTKTQVDEKLQNYKSEGAKLVLTIACIIETGNHIAQVKNGDIRRQKVNQFADFLKNVVEKNDGWMMFYSEKDMWSENEIAKLAEMWRESGVYKLSLGDASIIKVANRLKAVCDVEVFTGDSQLRGLASAPVAPIYAPAKRRN